MKKINMSDIAEKLNISKVSVSKALNDKEGVSEDLRLRVKETARSMGYRLNNSARSLKTDKQFNVGILIAEKYTLDNESYYFTVCGEMIRRLDELGYSGIMEIVTYHNEKKGIYPRLYNENKVDGIIVLGQMCPDYLWQIDKVKVPIIFFDFYVNEFKTDCVVTDNFFSAYTLTNHLVKQHHRDIAYVGSIEATSSIQDRFLGYYKSLIENQIPLRSEYLIPDRDELGQFIDLQLPSPLPSAFVCNCDRVAHMLINTLKKQGLKVPENCSVVGFDNSLFSIIGEPRITTIDNNIPSMVETAVKMITKKIVNPQRIYGRILTQGSLVIRDSAQERPVH
jgi:LacI family transcriptional regulator